VTTERAPARRRRSLSNVGGAVDTGGDRGASEQLAHALDVAPAEQAGEAPREGTDRAHVHGFHAYPARMHPDTASRLVNAFSAPGQTVLDPFAGSGTVLVEAMLANRAALGTDLNPLAVRLARLKVEAHDDRAFRAWHAAAADACAFADARRRARAGATRRYPPADVALFDPHVLLELDGLRAGIEQLPVPALRDPLLLVLSAILLKVSRKEGDTSERMRHARIAAGYPSKLFSRKVQELTARAAAFEAALPRPRPRAAVTLEDATVLKSVPSASVDAIVTSPPYVATYDYIAHHAARMRWLGLDDGAFEAGELGARRRFGSLGGPQAKEVWSRELGRFLSAAARVLRPGAPLILLMADSAVGRMALRADELVADIAPGLGLLPVARASQARPHFHGPTVAAFDRAPRREHALFLERQRRATDRSGPPKRQRG
jgi:hypothetical protein